jgi:hypothetical protein
MDSLYLSRGVCLCNKNKSLALVTKDYMILSNIKLGRFLSGAEAITLGDAFLWCTDGNYEQHWRELYDNERRVNEEDIRRIHDIYSPIRIYSNININEYI